MGLFLEEDLPLEIRINATGTDEYANQIVTTSNGNDYRSARHKSPRFRQEIGFLMLRDETRTKVMNLYHRAFGQLAGFRVSVVDDKTTAADGVSAPAATDSTLTLVSNGVYQLSKQYGKDKSALSIGYPERRIFKPVAGTVVCGIHNPTTGDKQLQYNGGLTWSVDTTTGLLTLGADKVNTISAITNAANAVITLGAHFLAVGDLVYISGVVGMTGVNGRRAIVLSKTSTTITVDINTSGYSAYSSGGTTNTRPQSGEIVTGGCEFKYPMRFDSQAQTTYIDGHIREVSLSIVELLNP